MGMNPRYQMRLKEIEERIENDLKPLWGKLRTVDDIRFLLDLVKMQQAEIELLRREIDARGETLDARDKVSGVG